MSKSRKLLYSSGYWVFDHCHKMLLSWLFNVLLTVNMESEDLHDSELFLIAPTQW